MESAVTIGLDLGKSIFQVHGVDGGGAVVALANKMARMIWAMIVTGERYREPMVAAA
jgi:hypothetical protein